MSASSERFIKQAQGLPEAYLHAITVGQRGAVTLGGETIDEASRKNSPGHRGPGVMPRASSGQTGETPECPPIRFMGRQAEQSARMSIRTT